MFKELNDKMETGVFADMGMTESTQDKLESVKAALEFYAAYNGNTEGSGMYLNDRDVPDYGTVAKEALTTLESLQADIASEEMVEIELVPAHQE